VIPSEQIDFLPPRVCSLRARRGAVWFGVRGFTYSCVRVLRCSAWKYVQGSGFNVSGSGFWIPAEYSQFSIPTPQRLNASTPQRINHPTHQRPNASTIQGPNGPTPVCEGSSTGVGLRIGACLYVLAVHVAADTGAAFRCKKRSEPFIRFRRTRGGSGLRSSYVFSLCPSCLS